MIGGYLKDNCGNLLFMFSSPGEWAYQCEFEAMNFLMNYEFMEELSLFNLFRFFGVDQCVQLIRYGRSDDC